MKDMIRLICLVAVALGMYREDLETALGFIALMGVVFWAIPEMITFAFRKDDKHERRSD